MTGAEGEGEDDEEGEVVDEGDGDMLLPPVFPPADANHGSGNLNASEVVEEEDDDDNDDWCKVLDAVGEGGGLEVMGPPLWIVMERGPTFFTTVDVDEDDDDDDDVDDDDDNADAVEEDNNEGGNDVDVTTERDVDDDVDDAGSSAR